MMPRLPTSIRLLVACALAVAAQGAESMIRSGTNHTVYLDADGTVWTWGSNANGQLGAGSLAPASRSLAAKVPGLTRVTAVAAGNGFTLALTATGQVYGWGKNDVDQLGLGGTGDKTSPTLNTNANLFNIIAIAAGDRHALALRADGRIYAWGEDDKGQCGDDLAVSAVTSPKASPVLCINITNAIAIGVGANHSLAVKGDGTVWVWGENGNGQLGIGAAPATQPQPTQIPPATISTAVAVAGGTSHSLVLLANGQMRAMGSQAVGQVGNNVVGGTFSSPVTVLDSTNAVVTNATAIACGNLNSYALRTNGSVLAWGVDSNGQLGDNAALSLKYSATPTTAMGLVRGIAAGASCAFALRSDGTLRSWGQNSSGQLGISGNVADQPTPVAATVSWPLLAMMQVDGGEYFSIALKCDGTVWTCGSNSNGELGLGSGVASKGSMTQVAGLTDVVKVVAGSHHCLVLRADGTAWTWGQNGYGQTCSAGIPTYTPFQVPTYTDFRAIAAGAYHSLAIRGDGSLAVWGADYSYQLGDASTTARSLPLNLSTATISNVVSAEAGWNHSLAIDAQGRVWAWGSGSNGEIGDGLNGLQQTPKLLTTFPASTQIKVVAGGENCSSAVSTDGNVWVWGTDNFEQQANGVSGAVNNSTPFNLGGGGITQVTCQADYGRQVCVLFADSSYYAWGDNSSHQCGVNTATSPLLSPVGFAWGPPLTRVSAGDFHTVAVTADGDLMACGQCSSGQLGIAAALVLSVPIDPPQFMDRSWYPVITITASTPNASESGSVGVFTVTRSTGYDYPLVITMGMGSGNTATAASDYSTLPDTVTLAAGSASQTVAVTPINDAFDEDDEFVVWAIAAGTGYQVTTTPALASATVTIADDDTANIIASVTSGLITTEAGAGTATFTLVLASRPTASVTINLASTNTGEGTVSPASVVFGTGAGGTLGDWNVAQTVTITGVDDSVDDGNIAYSITPTVVTTDPRYSPKTPGQISVTNIDDDTRGVTVSSAGGSLITHENALLGQGSFTVKLNSQPTANVTIALSSSNTAEGLVSPSSLTFTPSGTGRWDVPQTVTVTGVDDQVDDGDIGYSIVLAAAVSGDGTYNGFDAPDVAMTNVDDDTRGLTTGAVSGHTTEAGGTATFTVRLASQPTGTVTVFVLSQTAGEGTASPASLTFTTAGVQRWDLPQTVTVTGADDPVIDGNQGYNVRLTASGADYAALPAVDVPLINDDNDVAGAILSTTSITTTEGGTATFTVRLSARPATGATVTMSLASNNLPEATVSPASLSFDSTTWSTPQTVTVTGVPDGSADGDQPYTIITGNLSSPPPAPGGDPNFHNVVVADVTGVNKDVNGAGVIVSPVSGLVTTEAAGVGHSTTFNVHLTTAPTANVTITGFASSNTSEGTVSPTSLTFTPVFNGAGGYNVDQTITVTGVDDAKDDGDVVYTITAADVTSADAIYDALTGAAVSTVTVTNRDDDTKGVVVSPTSGLSTTEAGGVAVFSVVLTSQPIGSSVTIPVASTATAEGTVSSALLTFTTANWNAPQIVTVTGVNDSVDDGDIAYTITLGACGGAGGVANDYSTAAIDPTDVSVVNIDDDTKGVTIAQSGGSTSLDENGGTDTYTVVLNSQPTASVTISIDPGQQVALVNPIGGTLTFTGGGGGNWNVPQTVTVQAVDDAVAESVLPATHSGVVTHSATGGGYDGIAIASVTAAITDNDTAAVVVSGISGDTQEDGTSATFTVSLATKPAANVTILVSSSDTTEGQPATNRLTFTPLNYSAPQTVRVDGIDDALDDGDIAYAIQLQAISADPRYDSIPIADVAAINDDDDAAGVIVSTDTLATTEAGGSATVSVVLTSQPLASVTVSIPVPPAAEGDASTVSLTFGAGNWFLPQAITITGVDDDVADGDQTYPLALSVTSADAGYNGRVPRLGSLVGAPTPALSVTNADDETASVLLSSTSMTTTEAGADAFVTLSLASQPIAPVTIAVGVPPAGEGTASTTSLVFDSSNWSTPQTITVTGLDDDIDDGNATYPLSLTVTSADPAYDGLVPLVGATPTAAVSVTNIDDDAAGYVVSPTAGLTTTEAAGPGHTASFTVVLTSQPLADVVIPISSSDPAEGQANVASLTFTSLDWWVPQTVTVTGQDEQVVDGLKPYQIVLGAPTTADSLYAFLNPPDVSLTNQDDDVPGVAIVESGASTNVVEGGATDSYTVSLTTDPGVATVTVTANADAQVRVNGAASVVLSFDTTNWSVAQTVTVSAVVDTVNEATPHLGVITHAVANYGGVISASAVNVGVTDDDPPVVTSNIGPAVVRGGAVTIDEIPTGLPSDATLIAADAEESARFPAAWRQRISYNILLEPGQGSLLNGATILHNGDTFTQDDIANGVITYQHAGGAGATDGFAFQVSDSVGNLGPLTVFNITVTGFNPAVIALTSGTLAYVENDPATRLDGTATVTDTDSLVTYDTGRLTADITVGFSPLDELTIRDQGVAAGQIGLGSSNTVTYGGVVFASWSGGIGAPLVVDFSAASTVAMVSALVDNLEYRHAGENPVASKTVRLVIRDDTGTVSAPATIAIAVTPVDDAPTVACGASNTVVTAAGVAFDGTIDIGDAESDDVAVSLFALPGKGVVSSVMPTTLSFAGTTTSFAFRYTPIAGQTGVDSFVIRADDGNGGVTNRTVTVIITGNGAVRPWVVSDAPIEIDELGVLSYDLAIDTADYVATATALPATMTYSLVGVPASALVQFSGVATATVGPGAGNTFPVTLTVTDQGVGPGTYISFGILVTDGSNNAVGYQPVTIHIVPAGGGGG